MASHHELLADLAAIVSADNGRATRLQAIANRLRDWGNYRWVGLYDVDHTAGIVRMIVWSGSGPPQFPTFPVSQGLTSAAVAGCKTINVGDVAKDSRYLTAFGTTRSEMIVPVFDRERRVVGTIDVESERPNAFGMEGQAVLEDCSRIIQPLWLMAAAA